MSYIAKLTAAGAALLAAATSVAPVPLATMRLGDADGTPYTPVGNETDLVNQVASEPISSWGVDPDLADQIVVTATFPAEDGPYTVREVGIFTTGGVLFALANFPATIKPDPDDGAGTDLIVNLKIRFSGAASINVTIDSSTIYTTPDDVRSMKDFFAVISATTLAQPGSPAVADQYLVPTGATGGWAAQVGKIAIYRGSVQGWQYVSPPVGAQAGAGDSNRTWRKRSNGLFALSNNISDYNNRFFL